MRSATAGVRTGFAMTAEGKPAGKTKMMPEIYLYLPISRASWKAAWVAATMFFGVTQSPSM